MEPTLAEIRLFAGNFAPRSWALCQGQLLPINQNQALFSILGTTFGGDGRTTFGLPDMRGRTAIHAGNGPGLTNRRLGSKGGAETETLNTTHLPDHHHTDTFHCNTVSPTSNDPVGGFLAPIAVNFSDGTVPAAVGYAATKQASFPAGSTGKTGGNQSIDIRQPWIALNYIIALFGVFPSRS